MKRKAFYKPHRWIGVNLSILLFIVCFSGTLATLSHEIEWLLNPAYRAKPTGWIADKNSIVTNLKNEYPQGTIVHWRGAVEKYLCDVIQLKTDENKLFLYINPYNGAIQGASRLTLQRYLRDLHYFLFIPFGIGHYLVLFFAFCLLVQTITALLFYKNWFRKFFFLRKGRKTNAVLINLHRLSGLWSLPLILLFSLTGIWYFAERINVADIRTTANMKMPILQMPIEETLPFERFSYDIDYNRAVKIAKSYIPNLNVKDITPPSSPSHPLYLTGSSEVQLVRNRANRVYIHPTTYQVIQWQKADSIDTVTWLNDIADPLHFGTWGGLVTKLIWFLFGLAISGLTLTGLKVGLQKRVNRNLGSGAVKRHWKYAHWLIIGLILFFMNYFLVAIYSVPWPFVIMIALVWLLLILSFWYLFFYKTKLTRKKSQTSPFAAE